MSGQIIDIATSNDTEWLKSLVQYTTRSIAMYQRWIDTRRGWLTDLPDDIDLDMLLSNLQFWEGEIADRQVTHDKAVKRLAEIDTKSPAE